MGSLAPRPSTNVNNCYSCRLLANPMKWKQISNRDNPLFSCINKLFTLCVLFAAGWQLQPFYKSMQMNKAKSIIWKLPVWIRDQNFFWIHYLRFSLRSHAHGGHHLGVASDGNLPQKRNQLKHV